MKATTPFRGWIRRVVGSHRHSEGAISIRVPLQGGHVDQVAIHGDRVLSVSGWAADLGSFRGLTLRVGNERLQPVHVFRVPRSDVAERPADGAGFVGAVAEWMLPAGGYPAVVESNGQPLIEVAVPDTGEPAYARLRNSPDIHHREHIYGSGPPVHDVAADSLTLALTLPEPILDFGCGGGALIRALRAEGRDVYGLELDRPQIQEYLLPEAAPFVTLYDGRGPAPFAARKFASVTCCEVLEHMPDPVAAVAELTRLAREKVLVTVPDMSAIPRGFHHGVVPWHLLEATHVNFFTQHSLETALDPHASHVEMSRIGEVRCGPFAFYTSLAAVATLRTTL